jgi:hypothetical protein
VDADDAAGAEIEARRLAYVLAAQFSTTTEPIEVVAKEPAGWARALVTKADAVRRPDRDDQGVAANVLTLDPLG